MEVKKSRDWHPCGDYRALNNVTKPYQYPIPHIQDFTATVQGPHNLFKNRSGTSILSHPCGASRYSQDGCSNPAQTFRISKYAIWFLQCRADFSAFHRPSSLMPPIYLPIHWWFPHCRSSSEEHKHHLCVVFQNLDEYGIVINPLKCMFRVKELTFFGHHVSSSGIQALQDKVQAVRDSPQPYTQLKQQK